MDMVEAKMVSKDRKLWTSVVHADNIATLYLTIFCCLLLPHALLVWFMASYSHCETVFIPKGNKIMGMFEKCTLAEFWGSDSSLTLQKMLHLPRRN